MQMAQKSTKKTMIEKHEHTHKSCYDGLNLMQERKYRLCFVDLLNKVDLVIQWTFDMRMNGHEWWIFYNCTLNFVLNSLDE